MLERALEIASGGGSLVLGLVDSDLRPYATRGWHIEPVGDQSTLLRVVFHMDPALAHVPKVGGSISVTTADLFTYEAIQAIGVIRSVGEPAEETLQGMRSRVDAFVRRLTLAHQDSEETIRQMLPPDFTEIVFEPDEFRVQTPGKASSQGASR